MISDPGMVPLSKTKIDFSEMRSPNKRHGNQKHSDQIPTGDGNSLQVQETRTDHSDSSDDPDCHKLIIRDCGIVINFVILT